MARIISSQVERMQLARFLADHVEPVRYIDPEAATELTRSIHALDGLLILPAVAETSDVWTRPLLLRSLSYALTEMPPFDAATDRLLAAITLLRLPAATCSGDE